MVRREWFVEDVGHRAGDSALSQFEKPKTLMAVSKGLGVTERLWDVSDIVGLLESKEHFQAASRL